MWIQIILSILLAVVAVRVISYAARHELVPAIGPSEDFTVRMPRTYLLVGIVLLLLACSFTLSMIVWRAAEILPICGTVAVGLVGLWFVLTGGVWRIEVRRRYLIAVSALGVKRLVHYDDIETARVTAKGLILATPLKAFKVSLKAIYVEDLLHRLADEHVPVHRD